MLALAEIMVFRIIRRKSLPRDGRGSGADGLYELFHPFNYVPPGMKKAIVI